LSYRRSLSFSEHEKELVDYFDENGKSDVAKEALKGHMNKNNNNIVLTDAFHEAFTSLLKQLDNYSFNGQPKDEMKNKMTKLIKR